MLIGDFNAHSSTWDNNYDGLDSRGRKIEKVINDHNLICMNTGSPTHFNYSTGKKSAIDLVLTNPNAAIQYEFSVHHDLCRSDHYPLICTPLNIEATPNVRKKWILKRANWQKYQKIEFNKQLIFPTINHKTEYITSEITNAAKSSIPMTNISKRQRQVPWWTPEVKQCIIDRRKAERLANKRPYGIYLQNLRKTMAISRKVIKEAKTKEFQKYVKNITTRTNPEEMWRKIRSIDGIRPFKEIKILEVNDILITNKIHIAESLANFFYQMTSSNVYDDNFRTIKTIQEGEILNVQKESRAIYNLQFTLQEMYTALRSCKGSSPGPDGIQYEMIQMLPEHEKLYILSYYNEIWEQQEFPNKWKESLVLPILKPGKNPTQQTSYRPISLTNCLCKVLEKMVAKRLHWIAENSSWFSTQQFGFRRKRSTTDALALIEVEIQKAVTNKEHFIAVFLDLEKAYDRTWRHRILKILNSKGIEGNMYYFIKNFLSNRQFRVLLGNLESQTLLQENGVPQGAILSVILFLIAINEVADMINYPIEVVLYADDVTIFCHDKNLNYVIDCLQHSIDRIQEWTQNSGFKIAYEKTKALHITKLRSFSCPKQLSIAGNPVEYTLNHKFLGVHFDSKHNWKVHIQKTKVEGMRRTNILKVLSNKQWGLNKSILLKIHQALILSKLEYGAITFHGASKSTLKHPNSVHNIGIRLASGAYRSSPVESIMRVAGVYPLRYCLSKRVTAYISRLLIQNTNPLHKMTTSFGQNRQSSKSKLLNQICHTFSTYPPTSLACKRSKTPFWLYSIPEINLELSSNFKNSCSSIQYKQNFRELCEKFKNYVSIYTDGSKIDNFTGAAVVTQEEAFKYRLADLTSAFEAECFALWKATKWIENDHRLRFVIFIDSKSTILATQNIVSEHPIIHLVLESYQQIKLQQKMVKLVWIPSHIGIKGNETADKTAKEAITELIDKDSYQSLPTILRLEYKKMKALWEEDWKSLNQKLYQIKPTIEPFTTSNRVLRREEVVLTRIRIGHTNITHSFLMSRDQPPMCETCNCNVTVQHILVECQQFNGARRKFQFVGDLKDIK